LIIAYKTEKKQMNNSIQLHPSRIPQRGRTLIYDINGSFPVLCKPPDIMIYAVKEAK
jgi:hypothetical protein